MSDISRRRALFGLAIAAAAGGPATARSAAAVSVGLFIDLGRQRIANSVGAIQTSGHSRSGRGAARYVLDQDQRTAGETAWRKADGLGRYWVLAETERTFDMYGARGRDGVDDQPAMQAAIDHAALLGGGAVFGVAGAVYRTTLELQAKPWVKIDLRGAAIVARLRETNHAAVSVLSFSAWTNGRISVVSNRMPGAQAACHAAVRAGPLYGGSPSHAAIDPQEGIEGWMLDGLTLETDAVSPETRAGKVAVQISGGAFNWTVRNIRIPDSAVMAGGIHVDWGAVGPVSTADRDMPANRAGFLAGRRTRWTTHPHHGLIENVQGGVLSAPVTGVDTGAHGVRLSGAHDIIVRNVRFRGTTYAGLRVVGGDLGFEFATEPSRSRAGQGIVVEDFQVDDAGAGYGAWLDSFADNVDRGVQNHGYRAMAKAVQKTDLRVTRFSASSRAARPGSGLRCDNIHGGVISDVRLRNFTLGVQIDEGCADLELVRFDVADCASHGILVSHPRRPPGRVRLVQPTVIRCGKAADAAGVFLELCRDCEVVGGTIGDPSGNETMLYGIRLAGGGAGNSITGAPTIRAVRPRTGWGVVLGEDGTYGAVNVFEGATFGPAVANQVGGLKIRPIQRKVGAKGVVNRVWRAPRAALSGDVRPPAGFPGLAGDYIEFTDPVRGGARGVACLTSGAPGVWTPR